MKKYSIKYSNNTNKKIKLINGGNINMLDDEFIFTSSNKGTPNFHKKYLDLPTAQKELHKYFYSTNNK